MNDLETFRNSFIEKKMKPMLLFKFTNAFIANSYQHILKIFIGLYLIGDERVLTYRVKKS